MNESLKIGDYVRLVSIPSAVEAYKDMHPETHELFSLAIGNRFTVREFNEYGMAEIWVTEAGEDSDNACADSLWVELECLEKTEAG